MGQKTNPISLRLQTTNRCFDTSWSSTYYYKQLLNRDLFLQNYLNNFLKSVNLSSGRYCIHHLQKQTTLYNFFYFSKLAREWKSKQFGLISRNRKKKTTRYFFKAGGGFLGKKYQKRKASTTSLETTSFQLQNQSSGSMKLKTFYTSLNQISLYKFKKKMTCFQNMTLWAHFLKPQRSSFQKCIPEAKTYLNHLQLLKKKIPTNIMNLQKDENRKGSMFHATSYFPVLSPSSHISLSSESFPLKALSFLAFFEKFKKTLSFHSQIVLLSERKKQDSVSEALRGKRQSSKTGDFSAFLFLSKDNQHVSRVFPLGSNRKELLTSHFPKPSFLKHEHSTAFFLQKLSLYKMLKTQVFAQKKHKETLDYKLNNYLESQMTSFYGFPFTLIPFKVKNEWQSANYLADEIVYFLEKRVAFRRLKTKLMKELTTIPSIRGVRITCSGRVGGKSKKAQRAKTECIKYGQTSLHVFSSHIDFSCKTARTSFGSVGVKVWICFQ